jgi:hypothetical protein
MIKAIMAIKDIKGKQFIQPHVVETVDIAIRDFKEAATDEDRKTPLSRYTSDYDLIHIGFYDPVTGTVEAIEPEVAIHGKHIGKQDQMEAKVQKIKQAN